jgi:hypothetical protein
MHDHLLFWHVVELTLDLCGLYLTLVCTLRTRLRMANGESVCGFWERNNFMGVAI